MIQDFEDLCIFIFQSVVTVISISAIFGTAILFAGFIFNATILAPYVTVTNGLAWFAIGWYRLYPSVYSMRLISICIVKYATTSHGITDITPWLFSKNLDQI